MKFSPLNAKFTYENLTQRNFGVYSKEDQKKLRDARVTIVGIGCDGGMDAYILARMGVGYLRLVDFDINEYSNLNRQPVAFIDAIGEKKVEVARKEFSRFNPFIEIETVDTKLTEENTDEILEESNVCIQGMDSMLGRIIFHRSAKKLGIPAVTMTGQPPFRSFISTLLPDGPTYEKLFSIDFVVDKKLTPEIIKRIEELKYERGKHASERSGLHEWVEEYQNGKAGWGITPERAYITSVFQVNEAIRIILGKKPQAVAPRAIISDIEGLSEFGMSENIKIAVMTPPNGEAWNYRLF